MLWDRRSRVNRSSVHSLTPVTATLRGHATHTATASGVFDTGQIGSGAVATLTLDTRVCTRSSAPFTPADGE